MYGTLTYDDAHLPAHGTLVKRHHQLFLKKLRQRIEVKVKYYLAGEYGEENHRPHYHFLLFGFKPRDLREVASAGPFPLYESRMITELWGMGEYCRVGDVSFQSANYVAGYVMKKVDQVSRAKKWSCDPDTGELHEIQAEYSAMSRGGRERGSRGVGYGWFDRYGEEIERLGSVRVDGKEIMPPRYYDELLRERDEAAYEVTKLRRIRKNRLKWGPDDRPAEVVAEEKRDAMAREVIARNRLQAISRRL